MKERRPRDDRVIAVIAIIIVYVLTLYFVFVYA